MKQPGAIERLEGRDDGRRLQVSAPFVDELRDGDSVAVNGVCLTVVETDGRTFTADLSRDDARRDVAWGRCMSAGSSISSGPFAQMRGWAGISCSVTSIRRRRFAGLVRTAMATGSRSMCRTRSRPYVIPKGSIAIDGISLTIASLKGRTVGVQIVPFTFAHTSLREARAGDAVNLETDVLGKYVARSNGAPTIMSSPSSPC